MGISKSLTGNDAMKDRLSRAREITMEVKGRKSGRAISIPVWFVLDGQQLYLLPVYGSDTQWYRNVLQNPSIRIHAGSAVHELNAAPVAGAAKVSSVIEKFRAKYGDSGLKLYSKLDVAVLAQMP